MTADLAKLKEAAERARDTRLAYLADDGGHSVVRLSINANEAREELDAIAQPLEHTILDLIDQLSAANARADAAEARAGRMEGALREARDLLLERTHGNPARSAGHNARLTIEAALRDGEGA